MAINIKEICFSKHKNKYGMPANFNFIFKYLPQVRRMSLRKKNHPRERPSSPPSPMSRCVLQKPLPDQPKVVRNFLFLLKYSDETALLNFVLNSLLLVDKHALILLKNDFKTKVNASCSKNNVFCS